MIVSYLDCVVGGRRHAVVVAVVDDDDVGVDDVDDNWYLSFAVMD